MSVDLRTRYLGLELKHPIVASASPLTGSVESLMRLQAAGVAAVADPRIKDRLNQILALHTKQPLEKIVTDADRDFIMEADQAKAYGVVDHVIARREK